MAGDAVLIDERLWRGWRCRWGTLRLTRPDLDARDGRGNPAADEERQDRGESPHRPPDPLMSRANCATATVHCPPLAYRLLPTAYLLPRSIPFFSITGLMPDEVRNAMSAFTAVLWSAETLTPPTITE